jgi:hypothetical protein
MRDPSRIDEMLDVLGQVWKAHPDLRLGQLVNTAGFLRAGAGLPTWVIEDGPMLAGLRDMLEPLPPGAVMTPVGPRGTGAVPGDADALRQELDKFYSGRPAPLPDGVVPEDPDEAAQAAQDAESGVSCAEAARRRYTRGHPGND